MILQLLSSPLWLCAVTLTSSFGPLPFSLLWFWSALGECQSMLLWLRIYHHSQRLLHSPAQPLHLAEGAASTVSDPLLPLPFALCTWMVPAATLRRLLHWLSPASTFLNVGKTPPGDFLSIELRSTWFKLKSHSFSCLLCSLILLFDQMWTSSSHLDDLVSINLDSLCIWILLTAIFQPVLLP